MHTIAKLRQGHLNNTKELRISESLATFPTEILSLANSLEVLDLSGNNLSQLPEDFARLKQLKILFLSNNQFEEFPSVLAKCPKLSMIGIRNNKIKVIPENSLPASTRWLILTDNQIKQLPESIGQLSQLQKLMLAGNQLTGLPDTMAVCQELQLLRISANNLTRLPDFLFRLPKLSWLAFSGNPFCKARVSNTEFPAVNWSDINQHKVLGQGASGVVSAATWQTSPGTFARKDQAIVVKKYKGHLTSDGYSQDELTACITADRHPNLIPIIAQINDTDNSGLVMQRIDDDYKSLGQPPSLQSCTRDQFDPAKNITASAIYKIAIQVTDTMLHLLEKNLCHGDLYAHNILINPDADTILSDFGAASPYDSLSDSQSSSMQKIEVRAFGCLLEDLLTAYKPGNSELLQKLTAIKSDCLLPEVAARPTFVQIQQALATIHSARLNQSVA